MEERWNRFYFEPEILYEFNNKTKLYSHLWAQIKPNPDYHIPEEEEEEPLIPILGDGGAAGEFEAVVAARRSVLLNSFEGKMTFQELMRLVKINFAVVHERKIPFQGEEAVIPLRAYPSGGALFPVKTYAYIKGIDGVEEGLYRIHSDGLVKKKGRTDMRTLEALSPITLFGDDPQSRTFDKVNVLFFLVMDYRYNFDKYGLLAHRLGYLEAGHIAQNLLLTASYLKKSCLPLCGYYDDKVEEFLNIDGNEKVCIYMIAMG